MAMPFSAFGVLWQCKGAAFQECFKGCLQLWKTWIGLQKARNETKKWCLLENIFRIFTFFVVGNENDIRLVPESSAVTMETVTMGDSCLEPPTMALRGSLYQLHGLFDPASPPPNTGSESKRAGAYSTTSVCMQFSAHASSLLSFLLLPQFEKARWRTLFTTTTI